MAACAAARGADAPTAAAAGDDALARLTVVTCYSSYDLLATLTTLRPLLDGRAGACASAHGGPPPPPCRLLLLDNAAAFYWADRAAGVAASLASRATTDGAATATGRSLASAPVAAAATARLRAALRGHKVAAIIATHAVLPGRDPGGEPPDPLPPVWRSVATRRVALACAGGTGPRGGLALAVTPRDGGGRGRPVLCESGGGGVWPVEA